LVSRSQLFNLDPGLRREDTRCFVVPSRYLWLATPPVTAQRSPLRMSPRIQSGAQVSSRLTAATAQRHKSSPSSQRRAGTQSLHNSDLAFTESPAQRSPSWDVAPDSVARFIGHSVRGPSLVSHSPPYNLDPGLRRDNSFEVVPLGTGAMFVARHRRPAQRPLGPPGRV
jgi:hypothetical protein